MNYESTSSKAARAVRVLLTDRNESIEQLAESTGIAHSTLKRRLLVRSPFTIDELGAIAKHFGVPVTEVLQSPFDRAAVSAA